LTMKTETDPLTNIKSHLTVLAVIVQFVPLLCLEEACAYILKKRITVSDQAPCGTKCYSNIQHMVATRPSV
jgi:hypothetical protein